MLAALCVALLVHIAPAGAARDTAAAEKVLTLRFDGTQDALWLVSEEGTATAAGKLPGVAEDVAVSPDGSTAAYLPFAGKPVVWIGYSPDGAKTIDLAPAGVKTLTGMTWTSNDQLLISGSKKAKDAAGLNDRLYTVDVATGTVAAFRGLSGTEPNASPDTGKIAYVRFKKLDNGKGPDHVGPKYRESLMLTTVSGSGAPQTLDSTEYRMTEDYHAYASPQLAPGGDWIAYGTTGSDVSVTYHVLYLADEYMMPWFEMGMGTPVAMAWAPAGPLLALGGEAVGPGSECSLYVADAAGGDMGRTTRDLLSKASITWIMDMDWSDGGRIVADGLIRNDSPTSDDETRVLLLDSADLSTVKDLGEGDLSVWVR